MGLLLMCGEQVVQQANFWTILTCSRSRVRKPGHRSLGSEYGIEMVQRKRRRGLAFDKRPANTMVHD